MNIIESQVTGRVYDLNFRPCNFNLHRVSRRTIVARILEHTMRARYVSTPFPTFFQSNSSNRIHAKG